MHPLPRESWSDEKLLAALRSNASHQAGQAELLRLLRAGLQRALSAQPAAADWIDDFAQEAAIRVLQRLSEFRGESRFSTWALAIAVRVAFDELRRKRWRDISLDALLSSQTVAAPRILHDPDKSLTRQKLFAALEHAMNENLSPKQLLALSAEMKGMSQEEIGQRMGCTRNALYKLTHDARKKLKTVLSEQGITAESIAWAFSNKERSLS
jgi:RNA polymerase sigma-70 factor, ECF subfamily